MTHFFVALPLHPGRSRSFMAIPIARPLCSYQPSNYLIPPPQSEYSDDNNGVAADTSKVAIWFGVTSHQPF